MIALSAFFAGLVLALSPPSGPAVQDEALSSPAGTGAHDAMAVWSSLAEGYRPAEAGQVRIEQRIIWRIAPMPGPGRDNLVATAPQPDPVSRMSERRMGECLPMGMIAGGQPQRGSRLLLFLRDRRLVAADLEKACSARDFYAGFYVDKPNADGRLCADRDRILARNGARCQIASFRLLVPED